MSGIPDNTHLITHTPTHQPYVREFAGLSEYNTTSKVNDTHVPLSKFPPIFLLLRFEMLKQLLTRWFTTGSRKL